MAGVVQDHIDVIVVIGIYDLRIAVIILHSQTQLPKGCFIPYRCVNAHPITF